MWQFMNRLRLVLLLFFLSMTGCQPKSEIDKCVEAQALSACLFPEKTLCIKNQIEAFGGEYRLRCLRAQAGKE
jgi:hypothetical protein